VASEHAAIRRSASSPTSGASPLLYALGAIALLGGLFYAYLEWSARHAGEDLALTPEAKAYARSLKLDDVTMKATESYLGQTVVEIQGKIANAGARPLDTVEIYCIFHDAYGQLVLRKRLPIVSPRMGGLKPGETKSFRLPFDELPESWNQAMPLLVIAGVKFS
jgi:hypothetical protein